ncbi:MAG TPA: alpha-hydroxy acid oxidase [Solirubrobacteraceae bacterium]|jgi:4-hydroxymandelate oxidase|nr:alpha-hydroxy acid oxidase [Solirubrobacteraceae bacterium]
MQLLGNLEEQAREQLPCAHYDYFAGGAGDEQTLAENVAAWRRVWISPRVMVDVSSVDTSCTLLGRRLALPLLLAPMSAQRLLHRDGELAAARAAGAAGTVYCLSTRATADLAEVAAAAGGPLWFQLYVEPDRARSERVLARAAEHGFEAVVLTVDLPVGGRRERDLRHGEFAFPEGIALTSHLGGERERFQAPIGRYDRTLTWADVAWARAASGLPVIVKGVLCAEDAELALQAGAAAIVVSNHGGRQVDGCVPTAVALRDVVAAVAGRAPVLVDGGIRDGADVLRALALGADAVLVGRPYAWGLACGGEAGVRGVLDAFAQDLSRALALAGCPSLADVDARRVRLAGW